MHSVCSSGGELTPRPLADAARAAGLDFIATTEHNSADSHRLWGPSASDDLLVILGQEVVTESGHWLALGLDAGTVIDWRYGPDDDMIDGRLRRVHEGGGTRSLAGDVSQGAWRPALGDSDTHEVGQLGTPMTVVSAERLGTNAILTAIRAGRSWLAESVDTGLSLTAEAADERAEIGETLSTRGGPVSVRTEVSGVPSGVVSIHTERGEALRQTLPPGDDGSGAVEWSTSARESAFIRVEVRHPDGLMAALTNPIILV